MPRPVPGAGRRPRGVPMAAQRRLRAALHYDKKRIVQLIALAKVILAKILANPSAYPSPIVQLAVFAMQIAELEEAHQGVRARTVTASFRDTKRDVVVTSIELLRAFVQALADGAGEQAAALIEGAGMKVARARARTKPLLQARLGLLAGSVDVIGNAGLLRRGKALRFYSWQFSVDGGVTWHDAPSTTYAHTTIPGLPALTVCAFRVSVTDGDGTGEWSQSVTLLVTR